jgi:DNA polymerase I
LLNSRACSEFMAKVRTSRHRLTIRPCAQIHDAQYYLIQDDLDPLMFTNEHLVKAVNWNNHPDIYHPEVGLGGELSIFYPHWGNEIVIPNGITEQDLVDLVHSSTS